MENEDPPLMPDSTTLSDTTFAESEPLAVVIKPLHFVILSVATVGVYNIWWMYKCFRYFKEREQSDIMPALRAIFILFFGYELFQKILALAVSKDYTSNYSPGWVFLSLILLNILSRLPDPYWVVCILAFVPLLYPVKAFNFYFTGSESGNEDMKLNTRQIWLLVAGAILWTLAIIGLSMDDTTL